MPFQKGRLFQKRFSEFGNISGKSGLKEPVPKRLNNAAP
jgi:hypothetical protein